jgi:hypothetical protein
VVIKKIANKILFDFKDSVKKSNTKSLMLYISLSPKYSRCRLLLVINIILDLILGKYIITKLIKKNISFLEFMYFKLIKNSGVIKKKSHGAKDKIEADDIPKKIESLLLILF